MLPFTADVSDVDTPDVDTTDTPDVDPVTVVDLDDFSSSYGPTPAWTVYPVSYTTSFAPYGA